MRPDASAPAGVKRWSTRRKKEIVLRLLRGEPLDAVARETGAPAGRLEQWRGLAMAGITAGLMERENDPLARQLDEANRRIGELAMEIQILQKERQARDPLAWRRFSQ